MVFGVWDHWQPHVDGSTTLLEATEVLLGGLSKLCLNIVHTVLHTRSHKAGPNKSGAAVTSGCCMSRHTSTAMLRMGRGKPHHPELHVTPGRKRDPDLVKRPFLAERAKNPQNPRAVDGKKRPVFLREDGRSSKWC